MKTETEKVRGRVSLKGILIGISIGVFICIIAGAIFLGVKVFNARDQIAFTLKKPEIVKVIMDQYNSKQKEIDLNFSKTQETAEEKLIETLTNELKK